MRTRFLCFVIASSLITPAGALAATATSNAGVTAVIGPNRISLGNGIVERVWSPTAVTTTSVGRIGAAFTYPHDDFALLLDGIRISSGSLPVQSVAARAVDGGVAVEWVLGAPAGAQVRRTVEAYEGIAGFKSQTVIESLAPLPLSGYTLDEVGAGFTDERGLNLYPAGSQVHAFRAGGDWRTDAGWNPPSIGDPHTGDWRATTAGDTDGTVSAPGEWLSVGLMGPGGRVAMVSERRDYASSRMSFTGMVPDGLDERSVARAEVDFSRDVVYLGPFEEAGHIENPGPGPARHRVVQGTLALEPAFTIFPADADDEGWQFHKYISRHRHGDYDKRVMFNSDGVDSNLISTGAKDDMNFERFEKILPAVREVGFDTFIFDDGWMARSGDWCPDSEPTPPGTPRKEECTEPRWDGVAGSKFRPRFPDDHFGRVNELLAGDPNTPEDDIKLGLWMNPMEFNPASVAYRTNPQWACAPVGHALAGYNTIEPNSSSNEAGLGVWNPVAWGIHPDTGEPMQFITYLEGRIRRAVEEYKATYFKFDFLAWVDCGGAYPVDLYGYHDSFVDMVDRLIASYPDVLFTIDETNDYRMFPFESTNRGATWFANGGPDNHDLLHNVWNLSPFVPGYALGQRSFSKRPHTPAAIGTAMAATLLGHITFSFPIDLDNNITAADRAETRKWVDFYHANSDIAGMTYPLLGDPKAKQWTALQSWNGDEAEGWLLAFNQTSTEVSKSISLRGLGLIDGDTSYKLNRIDPATGSSVVTLTTAAGLRDAGIDVTIGAPNGYAIYKIERA